MNKRKSTTPFYAVIAVIGVLALGLAVFAYSGSAPKVVVEGDFIEAQQAVDQVPAENLGASSGTDHYFAETFYAGFGGNVLASTSVGAAYTLKAGELEKYTAFEFTPIVAATSITMPASTTLGNLLKDPGSNKTWTFQNASTSALSVITLVTGTGVNLSSYVGSAELTWPGAAYTAREINTVTCYRQVNTDLNCIVRENIAGD